MSVVVTVAVLSGIFVLCLDWIARYVLSLRRRLKNALKALEAKATCCFDCGRKDGTHTELCRFKQPTIRQVQERVNSIEGELRKIVEPLFRKPPDLPPPSFGMGAIGPSATQSREIYEAEKRKTDTTPKFANVGVLNPDLKDIQEAAREATNGRAN